MNTAKMRGSYGVGYEGTVLKQILLLIALLFIVYSNTFDNGFVWDDYFLIENNYRIHSSAHIATLFTTPFFPQAPEESSAPYWRPLALFSFALDYAFWRNNTFGFHLSNFLIHSLNAALVLLLWRAIPATRKIALYASLVFALHPLQTTAAAYISDRTDLLASAFFLLSCIFYLRHIAFARGSAANIMGLGVSLFLSLMAKEAALAAPLVFCMLGGMASGAFSRRSMQALLTSILVLAAYLITRHLLRLSVGVWVAATGAISAHNLCAVAESLLIYARLFFFPVGLHMERFLDIPRSIDIRALLSPAVVILLLLIAARAVRRRDLLAYPIFFALAALLPASNIVPLYPAFAGSQLFLGEQFLYLPMAGLSAAAALAFVMIAERAAKYRTAIAAGAVAVLAIFGILGYAHNEYWRDNQTFYSETLSRYPGSVRMNTNLGLHYAAQGRYEESIMLLRAVREQNPRSAIAHLNLGNAYHAMGKLQDAREELMRANELCPSSASVLQSIGLLDMSEGKVNDAVERYKSALALSPHNIVVRLDLATAYIQESEFGKAEQTLREALSFDPSSLQARSLLARVLERQGRREEAAEQYAAILRTYPDLAPAVKKLQELNQRLSGETIR